MDNNATVLMYESAIEKLPAEFRSLFDSDVPLPSDVQFYPVLRGWKDVLGTILLGFFMTIVGLGALLVALVLLQLHSQRYYDLWGRSSGIPNPLTVALVVAVVGIIFGPIMMFSARGVLKTRRKQLSGQVLRLGLFLTPNAVINHYDTNRYHYLSKAGIEKVDKNNAGNTVLHYRESNTLTSTTLPDTQPALTKAALWEKIQSWYQGGL